MNTKIIIRQCRIELLCAEYELDEGHPDKAHDHLGKIYRLIHYGKIGAGYDSKNPIPPSIPKS